MTMWKSKQGEKKEYRVTFGDTDFSIPTFGYKSSFFIIISLTLIVFLVPMIFENHLLSLIVGAMLSSLTFVYSQFFIQSKKGLTKGFWITFVALFLLIFMLLLLF